MLDEVTEEQLVLLLQVMLEPFDSLHDQLLHFVRVSDQRLKPLDESVRVQLIDVVAVLGQSHLVHQRRALVMET